MNQLLYTVEEVFGSYLNTQTHYFIPLYQRGYKWESKHIIKLLDDIHTFKQESNKFYCLQNITIVAKDNCFNVIDGQQRLTTLTVLLSILDKKDLVKNKIQFPNNSIRKETNIFINNDIMAPSPSFLKETWEGFISKQPTFDHQDIYHLFVAYKTIIDWFSKKEAPSKGDFCDKHLKNVKLIDNKVSENNSEEKIFGNLNSKRIPLDGADLVRAILITRVAQEEGKREADIKNIVRVNERRVKIGWELDQINNWWSRKEVKGYFSKFIQAKSEEVGKNKLFREDKYPFNLLLLLFAEKKGKTKLTLQLIEEHNTSALALYKELIKLDNTLQDWFNDREIYHYLGFLYNHVPKKDLNFLNIWDKWQKATNRDDFKNTLKQEIQKQILEEADVFNCTDEQVDWYVDNNAQLIKILLFLDVIHAIQNDNQPFLPYTAFSKGKNDIEHIFPQKPESIADKKGYIEFLNDYVLGHRKKFNLSAYDTLKNDENYQIEMNNFIDIQIKEIPKNSIGNLVLLYASLNRSLGRISYAKKRGRIIEHYNLGHFIQPHTFKVFARYFVNQSLESKELEHWTKTDIACNAQHIQKTINDFFKLKTQQK